MFAPTRSVFSFLHGWLGGISAVFIILLAGSGAMLAFVGELFLVQYGDMLKATSPIAHTSAANVTTLIASASTGYTDNFQTVGVLMPHSRIEKIETAMVFVMPSGLHASEGLRMLSVDPWSAQYKGDFPLSGAFAHELIDFHHSLLLGEPGIIFICILSILLMLLAFTGLYLWWPKRGSVWGKASRLNLRGGIKQILFSLHGWFGVWSALFVIYFCLTGLALAKPNWFSPLLSPPTYAPPISAGFEKICEDNISPDDAEVAGNQAFPNKRLATFFMPNRENGPYMLTYKSDGDSNKLEGDGRIYVHASCKNLVHVERAELSKPSVNVSSMLLSLHGGYTFGKPLGGILVILTGLSLIILAGTGLVTFFTRTLRRR
ncbi:PepSY-associated TM helix domain-containing protein [Paraglaciecola sp.]|uniref:PepSY-associated TM helix domain-containing protein n=1 Tax=Paraglaciecola sp. TaxID=1920173 RepID=UPI0030F42789